MGASAAAAIIIKRERDLVDHFRRAGATSPQTAQSPAALGVEQRLAWNILVNGAIIRTGASGTFYLDEASWEALGRRRRRLAVVIAVIALFAVFFIYYFLGASVIKHRVSAAMSTRSVASTWNPRDP
jgi:hypothetical protein